MPFHPFPKAVDSLTVGLYKLLFSTKWTSDTTFVRHRKCLISLPSGLTSEASLHTVLNMQPPPNLLGCARLHWSSMMSLFLEIHTRGVSLQAHEERTAAKNVFSGWYRARGRGGGWLKKMACYSCAVVFVFLFSSQICFSTQVKESQPPISLKYTANCRCMEWSWVSHDGDAYLIWSDHWSRCGEKGRGLGLLTLHFFSTFAPGCSS